MGIRMQTPPLGAAMPWLLASHGPAAAQGMLLPRTPRR